MWVARFCSLALLLTPAFAAGQAGAEPIYPEPIELEATAASETPLIEELAIEDSAAASEPALRDEVESIAIMTPITASNGLEETDPAREPLAPADLPEPQPLAASDVVPAPLKLAKLKPVVLVSSKEAEPLTETALLEPLPAVSSPLEEITPTEMEATEVSGTVLIDPLTIIVSLKDQRLDVYRGLHRVETTKVSSGRSGYQTLTGVFGILQKKKEHFSNLYGAAPMPWMQRLTRSGTAIHAGAVPNYPASHGCVRMPYSFAPKLFRMTEIGGKVAMMTGPMVKPERIDHPTLIGPASPDAFAEVPLENKVDAGVRAGARAAALPAEAELAVAEEASDGAGAEASAENDRPFHILVTRREERDIAIGTQEALAAMGYLPPEEKFVGYLGDGTKNAIRAFEKDHGLPQRGLFTEEVAAKIYKAAGKGPLPDAYLFLRKGFSRVRHVPVELRDADKPLGTHLFTYVRPSDGEEPGWVGISLEGEDSKSVLDRITVPEDMREEIAEGLTSGASFIVADVGKHSSVLPEGDDFIVRTNDSAASNAVAEKAKAEKRKYVSQNRSAQPTKRVARAADQQQRRVRTKAVKSAPARTTRQVSAPRGFKLFGRR